MHWFTLSRLTAVLTALPLVAAFGAPGDVLFAVGDGNGTGGTSELYQITNYATTPKAVNIGNTGILMTDLAINRSTRVFYAISSSYLYTLNALTGAATQVGGFGTTGAAAGLNALEFDNLGNLYSWGTSDDYLYKINPTTGVATRVGNTGFASGGDLAWDSATGQFYGTTSGNQLVKINPSTGAAITIGTLSISGSAYGLIEDSGGALILGAEQASHDVQIYNVNKATAAVALVGSLGTTEGVYGMSVVPEPGSALLVLSGLACLLRRGRRRQSARAGESARLIPSSR
jgi:hypothetical protein